MINPSQRNRVAVARSGGASRHKSGATGRSHGGRGRINRSYNCCIEPTRSVLAAPPERRVQSDDIAADIEAFMRAGGAIEVLT